MGYAVLNLSDKHVKRIPPGFFRLVRASQAAAYADFDRVAVVEVPGDKIVGPRPLRGRHAKYLDLVEKQPEPVKAEQVPEKAPEPPPAPEPEKAPEPEPAPEPAPEPDKPEE